MPSQLVNLRTSAYISQSGRCYYCGLPMWDKDIQTYAMSYKITLSQAKLLKCSAEHLIARQDGGSNTRDNIVAACIWCNHKRHQHKSAPTPEKYRTKVQRRINNGSWFPSSLASHFRGNCD